MTHLFDVSFSDKKNFLKFVSICVASVSLDLKLSIDCLLPLELIAIFTEVLHVQD